MAKKKDYVYPIAVKDSIRIYTDGSAVADRVDKTRPGGWGVYITDGKNSLEKLKGKATNTTISRMEMRAIQVALMKVWEYSDRRVIIYSDSKMVVDSINLGWLDNWYLQKFRDRVNSDIWRVIHYILRSLREDKIDFDIVHIKGHGKDLDNPHVYGNSVADELASYKG